MRTKKFISKLVFFVVLFLLAIFTNENFAYAHGEVTSQQQTIDNYVIEFEYDDLGPVFALEPYNFDFYLLDKNTKEKIPTDALSVVFMNETGRPVLGANLKANTFVASNGKVLGAIPEPGEYNVKVSFFNTGTAVAEGTFDFTALAPNGSVKTENSDKSTTSVNWILPLLGGLILGIVIGKKMKSQ